MSKSSLSYAIVKDGASESYVAQGQDISLASAIKNMFGSIEDYDITLGYRGFCFGFYEENVVVDNGIGVNALQIKMLTIADAEAFVTNPAFKESGSEWIVDYVPVEIFINKSYSINDFQGEGEGEGEGGASSIDVFDELLTQIQNQINPEIEQAGYKLAEVVDENTIKLHAQCTLKRVSV